MGKKGQIDGRWGIGIITILIGTIILMWGAVHDDYGFIQNLKSFAQALGAAIILTGIFGVILEWKSTKDYFGKRLSEIVLEDDYLSRLSKDRLKNLFISIQRHIFDSDDVRREGGFLDYFSNHLHGYIVQPYRENVFAEIIITRESDDVLKVKDKISYLCREMNGEIQEFVQIKPHKDEFLTWTYAKITVGCRKEEQVDTFDKDKLEELMKDDEALRIEINDSNKNDSVKVEIEQHYTVNLRSLQSWQMSHPTKGFKISISYPKDLIMDALPLLEVQDSIVETDEDGYYGLTYSQWMLPQSGITWVFDKNLAIRPSGTP